MPEMDGYEATAALRALESAGAERMTIVAMTANSMSSDRFRCLGAGMDDYVAKPVDFEVLRATLAKYLPVAAVV
jgi:two-component system sensor histidine kinase/response regulator